MATNLAPSGSQTPDLESPAFNDADLEAQMAAIRDATQPARVRTSRLLNLPYVGSLKQLEFHLALQSGMNQPVLYGGAMGGGKSAAICSEAIRECAEIPNNRVLMARKELVTFKRTTLETLLRFMPRQCVHRPSAQMFVFPNGSQLHYTGLGTEKEKSKLQSSEWGSIFIDEATEIDHSTFLMAGTRLRWTAAAALGRLKYRLTCNPEPGWLKEDFVSAESKKPGYVFIPALPQDNPHLPPGYIEQMREQLPPEWFRAYMLGDWDAFVPQNAVLDSRLLAAAAARTVPGTHEITWGVDVARFGPDETVIATRAGLHFDFLDRFRKQPIDETANAIITHYAIASIKPNAINVDDDGVGGGVVDLLRLGKRQGMLGPCRVNAVIAQQAADDSARYANMKSQLWFRFKAVLESGAPIDIPAMPPDLRAGLEAHRYDVRGGKAIVEPKPVVKARLGRSPDDADALILTMYESHAHYVAWTDPAIELERQIAALPEHERALMRHNLARQQRSQRALNAFADAYGVRLGERDDEMGYG